MACRRLTYSNCRGWARHFEAVEALGAVHVICTDKTGTLTKNELGIAAIVDPIGGQPITGTAALQSFLKAARIASEVRNSSPLVQRPDLPLGS